MILGRRVDGFSAAARGLVVVGAIAMTPTAAAAQGKTTGSVASRIAAYLAPLAASDSFAGVVLVGRNDTVLFEHGYGMANIEHAVPNGNRTRFRIHSITKQFTATAVMLLAQDGGLSVDSSIRTYLPELPQSWQPVTLLHLLTHTSGVPQLENQWYESFLADAATSELENLRRLAPAIAADTLLPPLGASFRYNNFGYDLLACVVEQVSGQRFDEFLRRRIFEPAGMKDAGLDRRASTGDRMYTASAVVPRLASGYNGTPGNLLVAFPAMFGSAGAGGMYATARDLWNYDRALTGHRLLSPRIEAENLVRAFRVNDKTSYGFGWMVRRPKEGVVYLEHSGGNNGYTADYARYPEEGAVVIVLTNRGAGGANVEEIRRAIARILLGDRYD